MPVKKEGLLVALIRCSFFSKIAGTLRGPCQIYSVVNAPRSRVPTRICAAARARARRPPLSPRRRLRTESRAEASAPRRVDRVAHEPLFVGVW